MFTNKHKCKCERLTEVKDDGYQYCVVCNEAHPPAAIKAGERGQHVLVDIDTGMIQTMRVLEQMVIYQRCKLCGRRFTFNSTTGHYPSGTDDPNETQCLPMAQIALMHK